MKDEIDEIFSNLQYFYNANIMVEDFFRIFIFTTLCRSICRNALLVYASIDESNGHNKIS